MTNPRTLSLALLTCLTAPLGCSVATPMKEAAPPTLAAAPAQAVLERSHFSRDELGAIDESGLQHVLSTPIDLVFPARVGVVPLAEPFTAEGDVSIESRSLASAHVAERLRGYAPFSHVSDVSTDLPNVGGLEGLRAIAARYRLRYLLLVSQRFEDDTHVNGWAALYPTIIGIFVTPSVTVASRGVLEADLLDVRTGTVLLSVVEPMAVESQTFAIGADREHRAEQQEAAREAAARLAKRIKVQTNELLRYADDAAGGGARAHVRILPAPIRELPAPPSAPAAAKADDRATDELGPTS
jgi:rhombotail lipoprotein